MRRNFSVAIFPPLALIVVLCCAGEDNADFPFHFDVSAARKTGVTQCMRVQPQCRNDS
jgi:hypothetical protein